MENTRNTTLTFALMDAPFEQARTVTALRIIDAALRAGVNVNVFAYEGAVYLPFAHQTKHANVIHGRDVEEEDHPLTREWIEALFDLASKRSVQLDWINCGLCVDERGAGDAVGRCRRGSPADFWQCSVASESTLVIGTR